MTTDFDPSAGQPPVAKKRSVRAGNLPRCGMGVCWCKNGISFGGFYDLSDLRQ